MTIVKANVPLIEFSNYLFIKYTHECTAYITTIVILNIFGRPLYIHVFYILYIQRMQYGGYAAYHTHCTLRILLAQGAQTFCCLLNKVALESDIYPIKDVSCGLDEYVDMQIYMSTCIS